MFALAGEELLNQKEKKEKYMIGKQMNVISTGIRKKDMFHDKDKKCLRWQVSIFLFHGTGNEQKLISRVLMLSTGHSCIQLAKLATPAGYTHTAPPTCNELSHCHDKRTNDGTASL